MEVFEGAKDIPRKARGAVLVENLLAIQARTGFFDGDSRLVAHSLVEDSWRHMRRWIDIASGLVPHKYSVAVVALALGSFDERYSDQTRAAFFLAMGNLLSEIETNSHRYSFNLLDKILIEQATKVLFEFPETSNYLNSLSANGIPKKSIEDAEKTADPQSSRPDSSGRSSAEIFRELLGAFWTLSAIAHRFESKKRGCPSRNGLELLCSGKCLSYIFGSADALAQSLHIEQLETQALFCVFLRDAFEADSEQVGELAKVAIELSATPEGKRFMTLGGQTMVEWLRTHKFLCLCKIQDAVD